MTLEAKINGMDYTIPPHQEEKIDRPPDFILLRGDQVGGKILIIDINNPNGINATLSENSTFAYRSGTLDIHIRGF